MCPHVELHIPPKFTRTTVKSKLTVCFLLVWQQVRMQTGPLQFQIFNMNKANHQITIIQLSNSKTNWGIGTPLPRQPDPLQQRVNPKICVSFSCSFFIPIVKGWLNEISQIKWVFATFTVILQWSLIVYFGVDVSENPKMSEMMANCKAAKGSLEKFCSSFFTSGVPIGFQSSHLPV